MPFFEWSDRYLVNIPEIDTDHRNLFALANRIHEHIEKGAGQTAILRALGHLVDYVEGHFHREERLMERAAYPDLAAHKKTHRMLEQIVHSMYRIYRHEPDAVDPDKLLEFMRDWLQSHILKSDLQYGPWINNWLDPSNREIVWLDPGEQGETSKIQLAVQPEKAWILKECARLLRENDWRAEVIEETVSRSSEENLEQDKALANVILR
jgi:hemerythrin-like metal-binding protein